MILFYILPFQFCPWLPKLGFISVTTLSYFHLILDIMLSKIHHQKEQIIVLFCLYEILRVVKFIEAEMRVVVGRGWRQREMESYCLMSTEF